MIFLEQIQQKITKEYLAKILPKRTMRLAKSKAYTPTNAYRSFIAIFLAIIIGWIGIYFPDIPKPPIEDKSAAAPTLALKDYVEKQKSKSPASTTPTTAPNTAIVTVDDDQEERAITAANAGNLDQAIKLYQDFLKETTGSPQQFFRLATLLQRNGQIKDAIASYKKILAHQPGHMNALSNLIYILKDTTPDQALETLEKYEKMAPASAKNYGHISYLFGQLSAFDSALKYAARAQNMDPNDAILLFNLAILYERVGAKTQAKNAYILLLQHHTDADLPWSAIRTKI